MAEERRRILKWGLRQNRGRLLRQTWLESLSRAVKTSIEQDQLLPLQETEELKDAFYQQVQRDSVQRLYWNGDQRLQVLRTLQTIRQQFSTEVILFSEVDYYVGGVRILSHLVLDYPFEVMEAINHDLALVTRGLEDGLLLELNIYGKNTEYELSTWGGFSLNADAKTGSASQLDLPHL